MRNGFIFAVGFLTLLCLPLAGMAQEVQIDPNEKPEIEKSINSYVAAYNAKDVAALVAHWTNEGVYLDRATGQRVAGHAELKNIFLATLQAEKDAHLAVKVESIEFVSPSVAIEEGIATITSSDSDPAVSEYNAVHVKREGRWLIDQVSEQAVVAPPSHYEQLKNLEWMIGDWVDRDDAGVVATECNWARNNNFLIRSFTVRVGETIDMAGMQIIGWDPAKEQIRSWTYDSDGGFNEGIWRQIDGQWTVQTTATLPGGTRASSSSIMEPLDENSYSWQQVDRVVGGELQPNIEEIVIVRNSPD